MQLPRVRSSGYIFQPMGELWLMRPEVESQHDQGRPTPHRARRRRDHAGTTSECLLAAEILALLSEPVLTELEEVTPPLRLVQGGRS